MIANRYLLLSLSLLWPGFSFADWPQWRGPERNGIASDSAKLPDELTEENAPSRLWESIEIPSDRYGGHGSVAVADGKVYLSVVWHRDEPTETRRIDRDVLSTLGYRGTGSLSPELREKMEKDRMNLSRRLRGVALDEWSKNWVDENIDPKTKLALGSWIASRFKKGPAAIPLDIYDQLLKAPQEFTGQSEMAEWVKSQGFDPVIENQIIAAVPATQKVADDVILCLDAETGEEFWRFSESGIPSGRSSSSTPTVADGKVFAALSTKLYCVDAETGEKVWQAPLNGKKGPASSPLYHDSKVYLQQAPLTAFDATSGEELWSNKDVTTTNSSPAEINGIILANGKNTLIGIDAYSGATLWSVPGGGDSTPVVSGNTFVLSSRLEEKNLMAYRLTDTTPTELWSHDFLARRYGSTPIIYNGNVYYFGSNRHLCVDLESGETLWEKETSSSISSPLLADGKILIYENKGGVAALVKASPDSYEPLGKTKVGALYCASPALVSQDLYLRTAKSVACFRFD